MTNRWKGGDIVAIRNSSGNIVATYEYDAWGKVTVKNGYGIIDTSSTFIGNVNPFRYRGYYYDDETGFYYLQTRYYDPSICRFISADNYALLNTLSRSLGELNLYSYCSNNPIMYTDPTGEDFFLVAVLVGLVVGAVAVGTYSGVQAANAGYEGWDLVYEIAKGVLIGGRIGSIGGAIVGAIPTIGAFMGSTFTFSSGAMAISVSGAQIAAGAATVLGVGIMLSKGSGPRFGHNQHEKQMFEEALRRTGVTDRDLRQRIHRKLGNYPYQDTLKGLIDVIEKILRGFSR